MRKSIERKSKSNKVSLVLILIVALAIVGVFGARYMLAMNKEQQAVRALVIEDQDLSSIHDGVYTGYYTYGGFTYEASVTIRNYTIRDIEIIKNRNSKYAKMAEGVVENILKKGNVNVEVVSGATTTSKALLKAIEQALACNL